MRATLGLWILVISFGAGTYYTWYVRSGAPPSSAETRTPPPATGARITISNFSFAPALLTVTVGTVVTWADTLGRHRLVPEDSTLFEPPVLTAGMHFEHQFPKPGRYAYYCSFHGDTGGKDMAGVVVVVP